MCAGAFVAKQKYSRISFILSKEVEPLNIIFILMIQFLLYISEAAEHCSLDYILT